jgi:small subunit ribosomal protein S8e
MQDQGNSVRRRTGGRRRPKRKKRKHELGRTPAETEVNEPRIHAIDCRGNVEKRRALALDEASVADGGETVKAEIEDVVKNPANPNYVRRNIVTKGAIIETSEGRARVTSRPGQNGQVNAVLIESES